MGAALDKQPLDALGSMGFVDYSGLAGELERVSTAALGSMGFVDYSGLAGELERVSTAALGSMGFVDYSGLAGELERVSTAALGSMGFVDYSGLAGELERVSTAALGSMGFVDYSGLAGELERVSTAALGSMGFVDYSGLAGELEQAPASVWDMLRAKEMDVGSISAKIEQATDATLFESVSETAPIRAQVGDLANVKDEKIGRASKAARGVADWAIRELHLARRDPFTRTVVIAVFSMMLAICWLALEGIDPNVAKLVSMSIVIALALGIARRHD